MNGLERQRVRVAFFDIAGTLVRGNPWHYLFANPRVSGLKIRLVYVPVIYHWGRKKLRLIDDARFRQAWIMLMASLVKGWSRVEIDATFADVVQKSAGAGDFYDDVVARVNQHRAQGDHVVFVSGMFDVFVAAYVAHLGADAGIGSALGFEHDHATGKIVGETINGESKLRAIQAYLTAQGFNPDLRQHVAYADSLSDLPMLESVGEGVAVYPESSLYAVAKARGWSILGTETQGSRN